MLSATPLPAELFTELRHLGKLKKVRAGQVVQREGEPVTAYGVLIKGKLAVSVASRNGRSIRLSEVNPGEGFGELLVDPGVAVETLSAIEASSIVLIGPDTFNQLLAQRPEFAQQVVTRLAQRLRLLTRVAKGLAFHDAAERTRALLLECAVPDDRLGLVVRPKLSQQAISERVGASRGMINRVMRELQASGFLEMQSGSFVLRPRHGASA